MSLQGRVYCLHQTDAARPVPWFGSLYMSQLSFGSLSGGVDAISTSTVELTQIFRESGSGCTPWSCAMPEGCQMESHRKKPCGMLSRGLGAGIWIGAQGRSICLAVLGNWTLGFGLWGLARPSRCPFHPLQWFEWPATGRELWSKMSESSHCRNLSFLSWIRGGQMLVCGCVLCNYLRLNR